MMEELIGMTNLYTEMNGSHIFQAAFDDRELARKKGERFLQRAVALGHSMKREVSGNVETATCGTRIVEIRSLPRFG